MDDLPTISLDLEDAPCITTSTTTTSPTRKTIDQSLSEETTTEEETTDITEEDEDFLATFVDGGNAEDYADIFDDDDEGEGEEDSEDSDDSDLVGTIAELLKDTESRLKEFVQDQFGAVAKLSAKLESIEEALKQLVTILPPSSSNAPNPTPKSQTTNSAEVKYQSVIYSYPDKVATQIRDYIRRQESVNVNEIAAYLSERLGKTPYPASVEDIIAFLREEKLVQGNKTIGVDYSSSSPTRSSHKSGGNGPSTTDAGRKKGGWPKGKPRNPQKLQEWLAAQQQH